MFETDKDTIAVIDEMRIFSLHPDGPARPAGGSGRCEQDECLGLIQEWDGLTLADVDPMEHAWRCAYREALRLAKAGAPEAAAGILAEACVQPNTHRSHFRLLFRLWRRQNTKDRKAGRHGAIRLRVIAMIRKDEELVRGLAVEFTETHGMPRPIDAFAAFRNLRLRDMKALLRAALALGDEERAAIAHEWIDRHACKEERRRSRG